MALQNLPRQPVLGHPHSENVFPDVQRESPVFPFVPIVSGFKSNMFNEI